MTERKRLAAKKAEATYSEKRLILARGYSEKWLILGRGYSEKRLILGRGARGGCNLRGGLNLRIIGSERSITVPVGIPTHWVLDITTGSEHAHTYRSST